MPPTCLQILCFGSNLPKDWVRLLGLIDHVEAQKRKTAINQIPSAPKKRSAILKHPEAASGKGHLDAGNQHLLPSSLSSIIAKGPRRISAQPLPGRFPQFQKPDGGSSLRSSLKKLRHAIKSMVLSGSHNGGTVPCKAIFSGDIPLRRPYIGLTYGGRYLEFRFLKWPLIKCYAHLKWI